MTSISPLNSVHLVGDHGNFQNKIVKQSHCTKPGLVQAYTFGTSIKKN